MRAGKVLLRSSGRDFNWTSPTEAGPACEHVFWERQGERSHDPQAIHPELFDLWRPDPVEGRGTARASLPQPGLSETVEEAQDGEQSASDTWWWSENLWKVGAERAGSAQLLIPCLFPVEG